MYPFDSKIESREYNVYCNSAWQNAEPWSQVESGKRDE